MAINLGSSYFSMAFDDPEKILAPARKALATVTFDTVVGTGLSGALVVPIFAREFGTNFAVVRKPGESNHDIGSIVGRVGDRWLFVDDFIASGATLRRVKAVMADLRQGTWGDPAGIDSEYVGAWLYQDAEFKPA